VQECGDRPDLLVQLGFSESLWRTEEADYPASEIAQIVGEDAAIVESL